MREVRNKNKQTKKQIEENSSNKQKLVETSRQLDGVSVSLVSDFQLYQLLFKA